MGGNAPEPGRSVRRRSPTRLRPTQARQHDSLPTSAGPARVSRTTTRPDTRGVPAAGGPGGRRRHLERADLGSRLGPWLTKGTPWVTTRRDTGDRGRRPTNAGVTVEPRSGRARSGEDEEGIALPAWGRRRPRVPHRFRASILLPSGRTLLSVDATPTSKRQAYKRSSSTGNGDTRRSGR